MNLRRGWRRKWKSIYSSNELVDVSGDEVVGVSGGGMVDVNGEVAIVSGGEHG